MSAFPHRAPTSAVRAARLDAATIITFSEVQCVEDGCTEKTTQQYEVLGDPESGPWHVPLCEAKGHLNRETLERFYPAAADAVISEKPKCPDHLDAHVVNARTPGKEERQWICLVCGKVLGTAPVVADTAGEMVVEGAKG